MTRHPGRGSFAASKRRCVIVASGLIVSGSYLLVRLTTLGSGWLLVLSIPIYIAELGAFAQFSLLTFQAWRVPPPEQHHSFLDPRDPVDIVIDASRADQTMLERTLVGTATVESRAGVRVVDSRDRSDLRETATTFGATYFVDERLFDSTAHVIHGHATTELYAWLEAGQAPMPDLITESQPRFDDACVAVCQTAVGLLNADSLVHVQRGRDEAALQRDVLGPGLARFGAAPWFGPASLIRRSAIDSIGGFPRCDPASVERTLVLLHADGWASTYERETLVRTVAPDTLDDYLQQRRQRLLETLRVFRTPQNPLWAPSLSLNQRLAHVATASMFGSGIAHFVVAFVLVVTLLTGRVPVDGPLVPLTVLWGASFTLGLLARRQLARGAMSVGDWTRQAWRTLGADLAGMRALFGSRTDEWASQRTGPAATGFRTLGRLRALTASVIVVDVALLLRAATLIEADLLPAFSTSERIVVLGFGLAALVPMVDVLQLVVTRRQRRRSFRLAVTLEVELGDNVARTVDLATGGVGVLMSFAPSVGSTTPIRLNLPAIDGTLRWIRGMAVVRSATTDPSGLVRVGFEFENLTDDARLALVEYCMIGHAANDATQLEPVAVSDPHSFAIRREEHEHRSLRALTGTAGLATLAMLVVGPVAASASEVKLEPLKAERVCVVDADGTPVPNAAIEQLSGSTWSSVAATDETGCVELDLSNPIDGFAATSGSVRSEEASTPDEKGTVSFVKDRYQVRLLSTERTGVNGASVRYFAGRWHDAGTTDAAGVAYVESLSSEIDVEIAWRGKRSVVPLGESGVDLLLGRIDAGGLDVAEIDRGDGWEPFHDAIQVMPGRIAIRLSDGSVIKTSVAAGNARELATGIETAVPTPTVEKGAEG